MPQTDKPESTQTANQPPTERGQEGGRSDIQPYRSSAELGRAETSPFSFVRRFMNDMDRLFGDFGLGPTFAPLSSSTWSGEATWEPRVDVFERDGQLVIHVDLPGLREQDVRVQVDDDVLTLSGERRHEHEHKKGGVYRCERSYGAFQRSIALPEGINPDSVQASFDRGLLEITMPVPKQSPQRGRQIPIRSKPATPPTVKH